MNFFLTTLFMLPVLSGAVSCDAVANPGCRTSPSTWTELANKDAYYWKFYSQPRGTDLRYVKPEYHRCTVTAHQYTDEIYKQVFANNKDFEFQQLDTESVGVNCIDCATTVLGHYYSVTISGVITCTMYQDKVIDSGDN